MVVISVIKTVWGESSRGTRDLSLPDAGEQSVDQRTGLTLPERPGLAELGLRPFSNLEFGYRNRSVLAVTLASFIIGKPAPEDIEPFPDNGRMHAGQCMAKSRDNRAEPIRGMLDAIDEVMGVLSLEALVEREGLQAGETDDVRMLDAFGGHPVLAQKLRLDLCDLMQVENHG